MNNSNIDLLNVKGIDVSYGQINALGRISLKVKKASIVVLLGRNGAGKSTMLKTVMGVVPITYGSITFKGIPIHHLSTYQIARLGIAYVPEDRGIFPSLTVEEHLTVGRNVRNCTLYPVSKIYEYFPILLDRRRHRGNQLSGGEQQMLALARALRTAPQLLILDEPTSGLSPVMVEQITALINTLKTAGIGMLIVEQNYPIATKLADYIYVLGKGRICWHGNTAAFLGKQKDDGRINK